MFAAWYASIVRATSIVVFATLLGCSNENTGAEAADGSGGIGGTAGSMSFKQCGDGVPCSPGATCKHTGTEGFSLSCECDESQHFFCSTWSGGGGGVGVGCDPDIACANGTDAGQGSCTHSNGFCTRECACGAECTTACDGSGPASGKSYSCDETCGGTPWGWCDYSDGACTYGVQCVGVAKPEVTGACP